VLLAHPSLISPLRRLLPVLLLGALVVSATDWTVADQAQAQASAGVASAPGRVVFGFVPGTGPARRARIARALGLREIETIGHLSRVGHLDSQRGVDATVQRLRRTRDVAFAAPDPIAHADGLIPNDRGPLGSTVPGAWQTIQWNFLAPAGVDAPDAWANLAADGRPGGKGVVIAVLDTGVAYEDRGRFRRSPDLAPTSFVRGYDFVSHSAHPDDRNGHGTHVASTMVEATGNGLALTGLAYGARVMPIRVLDSQGDGTASVIAQGMRFAVAHGAQVINLSLEFSSFTHAGEIPDLLRAIRYAHQHGVLVVAAAGNEADTVVAYPARAQNVVAVGATTEHECLADYSDIGRGLTLVAPGGGDDAALADPHCRPNGPGGRPIYQLTLLGSDPQRFGFPSDYIGTSMAAPHVSATAGLVIASGVIGAHPSPDALTRRLEQTARDLGPAGYDPQYGWGLVNAATATAPGPAQPAGPTN